MNSAEIRQAFFDYFEKNGHQKIDSSSLIPVNDPTLLFTNAGMVQFKDTFLGTEKRAYTRAVSSQKCVRAGGKHNDLENVGYTARHHTFFEMLGNFSFGDYFKREAIKYAWDFLTKELKLPEEKLWVSIYKDDDETADIWLNEMGVSEKRFSRCGEKDNFWSMGDTGPCGPCTEIFYDHGPDVAGGPPGSVDEDGDRYIEIWNIVFMQFNRNKDGELKPLPKPSVDTGMGLERIAAVIQGKHNNYEIDSFNKIIEAIQKLGKNITSTNASARVIADHIRACSFLVNDGVIPSNEGRGYVLRRIIRRAIRHGNKIGLSSPFFHQLVKTMIQVMGDAYPQLIDNQAHIEQTLLNEEEQFSRTLEQGLKILQADINELKNNKIPGELVFKLYDTYGFPYDLTADIAREQNLNIDEAGFKQCMDKQRQQSQSKNQFNVDYSVDKQLGVESVFTGYEHDNIMADIITILQNGKQVETLSKGMKGALILGRSSFYAESGGQIGDRGVIKGENGNFRVEDTQKLDQAIVHYGEVTLGEFKLNQKVDAVIDVERRGHIRLNHTATHLLHEALKQIVGKNVQQKGSLVDAERARFDFSHNEALTPEQLIQVEDLVNKQIRANHEVCTQIMSMDDAKKDGAVALFGEKYGDSVRVLSMGSFSKELCGGTHAKRTGDIGVFKIINEYGIASGIRRIEMVTGKYAIEWLNQQLNVLDVIANRLKTKPEQALEKINQIIQTNKLQEKKLSQLEQIQATKKSGDLKAQAQEIGNIKLLVKQLDDMSMPLLRNLLDKLRPELDNAVIVLCSVIDNKLNVIASVSNSILGQVPSAPIYVKHLCGKGGGRDDMAQGGSIAPDNLAERLQGIADIIKN